MILSDITVELKHPDGYTVATGFQLHQLQQAVDLYTEYHKNLQPGFTATLTAQSVATKS